MTAKLQFNLRKGRIALLALLLGAAVAAHACGGADDAGGSMDGNQEGDAGKNPAEVSDEYRVRHGESCIEQGDLFRCWDTYAPRVDADGPRPILIDLHAFGGDADGQRALSMSDRLADREGFVALYPYALNGTWNSAASGPDNKVDFDDIGFIRRMVELTSKDYSVDLNRIYVTGESNGCAMAQHLAAQASDLVAAVACMAFYLLSEPAEGYMPVPVMQIHGAADRTIPYDPSDQHIGAQANIERWRDFNGCDAEPVLDLQDVNSSKAVLSVYSGCDGGAEVRHLRLEGVGHAPYLGVDNTRIDTMQRAWDFMSRFSN